jgi:uncharacterized phage-like protein YoqJ
MMDEMERNETKKIQAVCFTGHRNIPNEVMEKLPDLLEKTIAELCERGATVFRTGGAMGFDTLAALTVLDMKETNPHLRLELILPCLNQTDGWDDVSKQTYHYIMQKADDYRVLFEDYFEGCMLERDRQLVDGSDVCVAYCSRSQGGTAYTFMVAARGDLEIINLYDLLPADVQD